jgi:glycyl-tRNA synthetase
MEDNTVTIRYRDSMEQERVDIGQVKTIIAGKVNLRRLFEKLSS